MDFRVGVPKIRIVPSPEARLRTLSQGADHAEALAKKVRSRTEPLLQTVYSLRTRIATGAVSIIAIWLFAHVMFGSNGMIVYRAKESEYRQLQREIDLLQKDNAQFSGQIDQLKTDPKRIEKEAREQFHYARPGEVIYVSPVLPAPQPPSTRSASK
jgi:cell division protein FtsB